MATMARNARVNSGLLYASAITSPLGGIHASCCILYCTSLHGSLVGGPASTNCDGVAGHTCSVVILNPDLFLAKQVVTCYIRSGMLVLSLLPLPSLILPLLLLLLA